MVRPCYLILDREVPGNISTRKLVIETAKLNVITAYDPEEGLATLRRYPAVDGVVFNAEIAGISIEGFTQKLREIVPNIPVIVTFTSGARPSGPNEHYVDSLDPKALLDCLESLNKEAMKEIAKRDPEISR